MRADILRRRLEARVRSSPHRLTVHYPAIRPVVPAAPAPITAPVNPLTGPAPVQTVTPATPTPQKPAVTLTCLWLDSYGGTTNITHEYRVGRVGWLATADALARVLVADAALDVTQPWGETVFDGAEAVEFNGRRYRVLGVQPVSGSFTVPLTYYVWLAGTAR